MKTRMVTWVAAGVFAVSLLACDGPERGEEEPVQGDNEEYHSPFYIEGEGDVAFRTVSFTDVGLNSPEPGAADSFLLETIAESLSYELASRDSFDFEGRVEYDAELQDPTNHLYCDREHLYVALWRGYEPERWGYSLWSGCHEQQKFEWKEVLDEVDDKADPITWVAPLTESIVDSVEEAHQENCYAQRC